MGFQVIQRASYLGDENRHIPAPTVIDVEATGAGDIFAAAYLLRLRQTDGNPWEAADFANQVASLSVTQPHLPAKIARIAQFQANRVNNK